MKFIPVEEKVNKQHFIPVEKEPEEQHLIPVEEGESHPFDMPRPTTEGLSKGISLTGITDTLGSVLRGAIAFPIHLGSFVAGGITSGGEEKEHPELDWNPMTPSIGWDYKKAMKAFEETGQTLTPATAPLTEEGKVLHDWITGNIDWLGNHAGKNVQAQLLKSSSMSKPIEALGGACGADIMGALASETIKMSIYVAGFKGVGKAIGKPIAVKAGEIRTLRQGIKTAVAKGKVKEATDLLNKELVKTKAELIDVFKEAHKQGDKETMAKILELQKGWKFQVNAAEIPAGKNFPLTIPEQAVSLMPKKPEAIVSPKGKVTKPAGKRPTIEGKLKTEAENLGITYEGRKAGKAVFSTVLGEKKVTFSPLEGETLSAALDRTSIPFKEETTFKATDNIAEIQKDINETKSEVQTTEPVTFKNKQERLDYLKKRSEQLQRERADELYENLEPDVEFSLDTQGMVQEFQKTELFRTSEAGATKPVTLQEVKELSEKKDLTLSSKLTPTNIEIIIKDESGVSKTFNSLIDAKEYVSKHTKELPKADKEYYDLKRDEAEKAPELVEVEKDITKPRKKEQPLTDEQIDFLMLPRDGETPPQPRISLLYDKKSIERLAAERILYDIPTTGKNMHILSYITPLKSMMLEIEGRTGLPLFNLFEKAQTGIRDETLASYKYHVRINDACKGLNGLSKERVYRILESAIPEDVSFREVKKIIKAEEGLKKNYSHITEQEFNSAKACRGILQDAGTEFGIPMERMVTDYAPRIRESGITTDEAVKLWRLPEEYKWWAEEQRTGYLMPHETNIRTVLESYVNRGARKKHLGETIEEISKTINDATENNVLTKTEGVVLNKFFDDIKNVPAAFDYAVRGTGRTLVRTINKAIEKTTFGLAPKRFRNIQYKREKVTTIKGEIKGKTPEKWEKVGEEPGFFDTQKTVDNFIDWHLAMTYAGALGYKPMALARNMLQPWITVLPIVGPRSFMRGMGKAMTRDGWNEAKAAGIMMDDYMPLPGEITHLTTSALAKVAYQTLRPYKMTDSLNRCLSYHAMKYKVSEYGKTFLDKIETYKKPEEIIMARDEFIENSGIDFFHPVLIKNEVLPLLKAKDINSLAERMGKHLSENTQWIYRRANAPVAFKGKTGRLVGQFGTWSAWYVDYMKSLATKGNKKNIAKRLATWGIVNTGIDQIGKEVFGVDLRRYLFAGPFSWFGGIAVSSIKSVHDLAFGTEYEKTAAKNNLASAAKIHIPAYLQAKSMLRSMDEYKEEDKLKRLLGFRPAED